MADTLSVYRSERKYFISYPDAARLKTRLDAFLRSDEHGKKASIASKACIMIRRTEGITGKSWTVWNKGRNCVYGSMTKNSLEPSWN